jgi:DNA-binding PucR family transcriptional regulator
VIAAAAKLHIHKNTLRYRLRRLTEIAGLDLSDPDTRLGLMLQLRIHRSAE